MLQQPAQIRAGPTKLVPGKPGYYRWLLAIYWMWQREDTWYELGDNLWQGTLPLILSDKNTVIGRHLGKKEAGAFQMT